MALGCQQGLGVCGHGCMAGLGVWGLLERKCEEKGRTKSAKERFWDNFRSFLGPFWKKRAEKESTGPKRAFRRFSEVPSTTKSTVSFKGFGCLGGRQERFREHFGSFLEPFCEACLVRSSAESRKVEDRSRSSRLEQEAL